MQRHDTIRKPNGTILQSAVPKGRGSEQPMAANGLFLRGVVMATYVLDDPNHPTKAKDPTWTPLATYCDVLCYSEVPGLRAQMIFSAMVLPTSGNMHNGSVWKPKASTMHVDGTPLSYSNPIIANMDGDHVLVGFFDNTWNCPFILCGIPHPQGDLGNTAKATGHRKGLKLIDGDPNFVKHHGAVYGITDAGDFEVDLTEAYPGSTPLTGGMEPPPTGGATGNYKVKLPPNSTVDIQIAGNPSLHVAFQGALATLTLGDGAKSVVIAENLQTWLDGAMKDWATKHTHPTGVGPSGVPTEAATYPAYDVTATSTHMKLPNG
jgi:hypothetical protein